MSLPGYDLTGYAPAQLLNGLSQQAIDPLGRPYDPTRYRFNPTTMSLEFLPGQGIDGGVSSGGGTNNPYAPPDYSLGTDVVTNLSDYNRTGLAQLHYGPGENPYFGFGDSAQGYNGGDAPNSGMFISADPNAIGDYQSHRQDVVNRGVAQVGALVGGAALGGALGGGGSTTGSGSATVTGAPIVSGGVAPGAVTTYPLATGGAITGSAIPGLTSATTAAGAAAAGIVPAAAAGAGAGLAGLGLGGWLTVGALGAQALQGNKDITTNQTNAPPAYIAPYLSGAAEQASNLYGQGNYVAPVTQSAIDYGTNVLNGNYLNSNPYLDETFRRASGAVTNQVQSNFGRSGRNARGIDAAGFAQEGYNDLANQIYGGNYQAERQRQQQILPYAGQLGSYTNPGTGLDDYIARLRNLSGGYGSNTSTTPTDSNWLSGLAGLGLALMKP